VERRQNATGNWPGPARQVLTLARGLVYQRPLDREHDGPFCPSSGSKDFRMIKHTIGVQGRRQRVGESTPTVEASEVQRCAE
jgi:hypothetical protein